MEGPGENWHYCCSHCFHLLLRYLPGWLLAWKSYFFVRGKARRKRSFVAMERLDRQEKKSRFFYSGDEIIGLAKRESIVLFSASIKLHGRTRSLFNRLIYGHDTEPHNTFTMAKFVKNLHMEDQSPLWVLWRLLQNHGPTHSFWPILGLGNVDIHK